MTYFASWTCTNCTFLQLCHIFRQNSMHGSDNEVGGIRTTRVRLIEEVNGVSPKIKSGLNLFRQLFKQFSSVLLIITIIEEKLRVEDYSIQCIKDPLFHKSRRTSTERSGIGIGKTTKRVRMQISIWRASGSCSGCGHGVGVEHPSARIYGTHRFLPREHKTPAPWVRIPALGHHQSDRTVGTIECR